MIKSLGPGLDSLDFLRIALGNQHLFIVIQNSNLSKPLVLTWPQLLQQIQDQINVVTGGVTSVNGQTGVVVLALDDLSDVNAASPTSGQFLQWNGSEWVPSTVAPGGVTSVNGDIGPAVILNLGDLNNVIAPSPSVNQILQWNGSAWVPATISTGVYTADNGLTMLSNNVALGSSSSPGAPLLGNRYIDTGSTFGLYLEGQKTNQNDAVLFINNTANGGTGLRVDGSGSSLAIRGESSSGQGVYGISNTSVGILGQTSATGQGAILASVTSAASNLIALGLRIRHVTSASPVAGLGVSIDFRGGTTINGEVSFGRLMYQWTDAVTASRTSKFQIETVNSATASVKLEVLGSGQLILNQYTTSTSFGSGLTSVGVLNVDNTGKVFVTPGGGGGGGVNAVSAGTGMNFVTITSSGSVDIDTTKVPYLPSGFSIGLLQWNGSAWVFDNTTYQPQLNGTGFVKASGTTITYDNSTYTPTSRQVATTNSLTGGGDLSADRTLSLVNDSASPGANKVYGTDGSGVRGWKSDPSGGILHATASGTNTYTASVTPTATAYNDGDAYLIRFTNGNDQAAPTLNIDGLGGKVLFRNNDGQILGGDIHDGSEMLCVYNPLLNGGLGAFQCIGTSPNSLFAYVTNVDTVAITKGMPVVAWGGTGDRMTVQRAYNTDDAHSAQTIGLVYSSSIGVNQKGFILIQGLLDGLNIVPTPTWADGDPVYLGATAGTITKTKPYAPNHLVYLGFVTTANPGNAGRIYVKVQNGYELDELHDVALKSPYQVPVNNDVLTYITGSPKNMWQARSIGTILGGTTSQYVRGDGSLATFPTIPTVTPSALTKVDDTNVTLTLGGTPSTALLQPSSLTLGWTGQLSTSRGGTGLSTIGTSTQYLRVNVPGTALEYATFPVVPSPVSVFPYQRTNYFKPSDNRDLEYYNNNLFMVNNSGNNVQVVNSQTTLTTVTTGGLTSPNQSSVITDLATPEVWTCGGMSFITRHNASTGAFIANTTPTGSVTNAAGSRYVSYSATKSIGGNGTNIFTINPATFVTANLAAHGIGAIVPHLDVNKNPSSAQNDHVMMGGPNGIILFNCNTNAIVLAATTLAGAIGPVYDIKYDPSNNNWIVVCTISAVIKIVYLRPLTATTFSVIKTIDTYSIFGNTLTPGNTQNIKIDFDTTYQYLFVMSYSRLYMYDLSNGDLLKTLNAIMLTGGNIQSASAIDTANKRLFFCTGGAGVSITYEYIYA